METILHPRDNKNIWTCKGTNCFFTYPIWKINGQYYKNATQNVGNVLSLDKLAEILGISHTTMLTVKQTPGGNNNCGKVKSVT